MLIDTHTHFYDEWLLPDAEAAIARALEAGVGKMIQADVDSRERDALWALNDAHPGVLYPMLGLYPGSVDDRWEEEIALLPAYRDRGIVAIGEIGLDYHEGTEWKEQQKEALKDLRERNEVLSDKKIVDRWVDLGEIRGFLRGHRRRRDLPERLARRDRQADPPRKDPARDRRPLPRPHPLARAAQ